MLRTWKKRIVCAALGFVVGLAAMVPAARAVSMSDYTWMPIFMQNTVPPNILFIVDIGDQTLPAAYDGTNHQYPISFKASTARGESFFRQEHAAAKQAAACAGCHSADPRRSGRTRANKLVHWPRPSNGDGRGAACRAQPAPGEMARVRITRASPWALRGEPAEASVSA